MTTPEKGLSALEINLQRTASRVEIPAEQRILLDATRESVGVLEKTRALLEEVNHPYANWGHVLGELRNYGPGNIYHHNAYEKGDEAIRVVMRIFLTVADRGESSALRLEALRALLRYLEKVVEASDGMRERNRPVVAEGVLGILERFETDERTSALLSGAARRLARIVQSHDPELEPDLMIRFLTRTLDDTYRTWLALPDPAGWIAASDRDRLPSIEKIRHSTLEACRARLGAAGDGDADRLVEGREELPDQTALEELYMQAADEVEKLHEGWEGYTGKVLFLLKILDSPLLRNVRETALRAVNRALSRAFRLEERPSADRFIDAVFDSFGRGWLQHDTTVLDCIHTIAVDVLRSGDDRLIQKVVDRILDHGFETPEIRGVNELWQFEVNPAHIKNIRSWVELIAMDPVRMRRLLAALVFHLRMGGVFVSDTDLFQKDMAGLLNADIRPVFNMVKQLGKLFPIYFAEIGAEGQVRHVSTRIDEIGRRHDSVIHFLRKQCHVESSYRLIPFCEAVFHYWAAGEDRELRAHLPPEIFDRVAEEEEHLDEMRPLFGPLMEKTDAFPQAFLALTGEETEGLFDACHVVSEETREKAVNMVKLYQLLDQKYRIGPRGVMETLEASALVDAESARSLRRNMEKRRHLRALETVVEILEALKEIVLDPEPAESREDIYHKRHIAAGIPSMYGRFLNRKLEALGLTYRLESFGGVLFEKLLEEENLHYLTKRGLTRIADWLVLFQRALWVDGISGRGLGARIDMLKSGVRLENLTIDQFINIFQFTSRTLREIIRETIVAVYENDMDRIAPAYLPEDTGDRPDREWIHMRFETFLRDQMSSCFALQTLDNLLSRILSTLTYEAETFSRATRNLLMSYDIDRCFVPLLAAGPVQHDPILLGHKGSFLRQMASFGYPVPAGFIVTTEVYRTYDTLVAFRDLRKHSLAKMTEHLREVERRTGRRFGDPEKPLLLSVRSGSAISMPGILDTFLNVGINEEVAAGLARQPRFGWAAWDSYRRFLQLWGISFGVPQETFDRIFEDYKKRYSVAKKARFSTDQIREVALACRAAILDHGVEVEEDPVKQLRHCIERVLQSWDADRARLYRKEMKIADDWGTAVVVQAMVYGNLDERSGTGVLFTRNPRVKTGGVQLYGDFVLRSQGEDVVRGVVETYPISEEQRRLSSQQSDMSLESSFPDIYGELLRIGEDLVLTRGFNHQEMEFTFEDTDVRSFYMLQARDIITPDQRMVTTFVATEDLERSYVGRGIGVGGGALSGRAAHNEKEIDDLWKRYPDCKIILLRANTVPEDMHMIFLADGLLTSRGGATSHAAVAAQRVGRTCVVGCRGLTVDERKGRTLIGEGEIRSGDFISINGFDGSVYLGQHEVKQIRRLTEI
ncbi:MAG: PEP/pyruvate-binding domain-containing protein [Candidatus Eisenbacteria bacterium]